MHIHTLHITHNKDFCSTKLNLLNKKHACYIIIYCSIERSSNFKMQHVTMKINCQISGTQMRNSVHKIDVRHDVIN